MEPINQKSKLYRFIKATVEGQLADASYPTTFTYCEGRGEPIFTFTIERNQEDHFIDEKGQKWIKAE